MNTNDRWGDGWSRSSDEAPVMGVEQRASIMQFVIKNNLIY